MHVVECVCRCSQAHLLRPIEVYRTEVGEPYANAELVDDAGDVTATTVARDLPRGAAIPAGTKGGGGGGGGSAGASSWLSRRLTPCRRHLSSSLCSASSCPLTPLLPFASCTPPLPFASCLPASCRVAPVVAPPPTPPRNFASTTYLLWLSQLATPHLLRRRHLSSSSHLYLTTRRLCLLKRRRLITGCVVARRRCADVVAVNAQVSSPSSRLRLSPLAIVALIARCQASVLINVDVRRYRRHRHIPSRRRYRRRLRRPSRRQNRLSPVAPSP